MASMTMSLCPLLTRLIPGPCLQARCVRIGASSAPPPVPLSRDCSATDAPITSPGVCHSGSIASPTSAISSERMNRTINPRVQVGESIRMNSNAYPRRYICLCTHM
jgi:hypothetical protein